MGFGDLSVLVEIDDEENKIVFSEVGQNKFVSNDKDIIIKVEKDSENIGYKIIVDYCGQKYQNLQEQLIGLFEAKYEQRLQELQDNFESGFEDIDENVEHEIKVPYDPQLITVAPAKFSLKEIVSMIDGEEDEEPILDLAPAFQREYVWDRVRKSRLIESILLNIPLPMIYLARDKSGKMQVVDGVQRLTTIHKFFHNEFKLTNLEYLGEECEGRYFKKTTLPEEKSLRPKLVRDLRRYQVDCNIIEPSTPENVKLDIFKRLNTGGKELNKQEVRHAFMKKDVREFTKKMVNSNAFITATDDSVSDKRMMAQELVLRYIGFYCLYIDDFLKISYSSKMDEFVDDVAIGLNKCKRVPYENIYTVFQRSMNKATIMFGNKAFRKIEIDDFGEIVEKKNPINKSLFISFSILLSDYSLRSIERKGSVALEFAKFIKDDEEFLYSISHNTNYQLRDTAMPKVIEFLDSVYK